MFPRLPPSSIKVANALWATKAACGCCADVVEARIALLLLMFEREAELIRCIRIPQIELSEIEQRIVEHAPSEELERTTLVHGHKRDWVTVTGFRNA